LSLVLGGGESSLLSVVDGKTQVAEKEKSSTPFSVNKRVSEKKIKEEEVKTKKTKE
jgi:hypothetical protein